MLFDRVPPQPQGSGSSVRNIEIRHLLLIATVVETGSLTRAGARLNLTQSALSHQLLDLEERLGTPLFLRSGRAMMPTPAGQRLLEAATQILPLLQRAEDDIELLAADRSGVLRFTTECYTSYHWLPDLMAKFATVFPEIALQIDTQATDRPFQALLAGSIDLALVTSDKAPFGLELVPFFEDEAVIAVSADHRLAGREFIAAEDFAEETLLTYSRLEETNVYRNVLHPAGIEPHRHMRVQLTDVVLDMVSAGAGIASVAEWFVTRQVAAGTIVALRLTASGFRRHWKVARIAKKRTPDYETAFIELLREQAAAPLRLLAR